MVNKAKHNSKEHALLFFLSQKERAKTDLAYVNLEREYINVVVFNDCKLTYNYQFVSESYQ